MANKWLTHVKHTMKTMKKSGTYKKGDGLKKVIMEAKKSYKKHKGGEESPAGSPTATPVSPAVMGGRRKSRKGGKTRRNRK